jgi:hypothetical protein
MKWRGILCALAALCMLVFVAPTASGSGCGEGFEQGEGSEYDADGDGLVCVNSETGEVSDDQGATPGIVDRNANGITCIKQVGNGTFIRTDDRANHPENEFCPPAFSATPIS